MADIARMKRRKAVRDEYERLIKDFNDYTSKKDFDKAIMLEKWREIEKFSHAKLGLDVIEINHFRRLLEEAASPEILRLLLEETKYDSE